MYLKTVSLVLLEVDFASPLTKQPNLGIFAIFQWLETSGVVVSTFTSGDFYQKEKHL